MSTVLWANILVDGVVESDEADRYALYRHAKKLDRLTRQLKVTGFVSTHDLTDAQFNLSHDELPAGMQSTDEVMAKSGVWISAADAVQMLEALIAHIGDKKIKFGVFRNDAEAVMAELRESLALAERAGSASGMFNFSVVM